MLRCDSEGVLLGVCAAISRRMDLDAAMIRILFILGCLFAGLPLLAYPILWLIFKVGER